MEFYKEIEILTGKNKNHELLEVKTWVCQLNNLREELTNRTGQ